MSVIQAHSGREGRGKATMSELIWHGGYGGADVKVSNEGGGSRAHVSVGRVVPFAYAGSVGVISGSIMAGILEPVTFGVFVGSVAVGVGVALGVGAAFARGAKRSVSALMDTIGRTMASMGEWQAEAEAVPMGPGKERKQSEKAARNIERLEALLDRRLAIGPRVSLRRVSFSVALGATLGALLPIALRYFPWEYPLPWMVVGFLGWVLLKTLRSLFRGIGDRKALDREVEAILQANEAASLKLTSEKGP